MIASKRIVVRLRNPDPEGPKVPPPPSDPIKPPILDDKKLKTLVRD